MDGVKNLKDKTIVPYVEVLNGGHDSSRSIITTLRSLLPSEKAFGFNRTNSDDIRVITSCSVSFFTSTNLINRLIGVFKFKIKNFVAPIDASDIERKLIDVILEHNEKYEFMGGYVFYHTHGNFLYKNYHYPTKIDTIYVFKDVKSDNGNKYHIVQLISLTDEVIDKLTMISVCFAIDNAEFGDYINNANEITNESIEYNDISDSVVIPIGVGNYICNQVSNALPYIFNNDSETVSDKANFMFCTLDHLMNSVYRSFNDKTYLVCNNVLKFESTTIKGTLDIKLTAFVEYNDINRIIDSVIDSIDNSDKINSIDNLRDDIRMVTVVCLCGNGFNLNNKEDVVVFLFTGNDYNVLASSVLVIDNGDDNDISYNLSISSITPYLTELNEVIKCISDEPYSHNTIDELHDLIDVSDELDAFTDIAEILYRFESES